MVRPPQLREQRQVCFHKANRSNDVRGPHAIHGTDGQRLTVQGQQDHHFGPGSRHVHMRRAVFAGRQQNAHLKAIGFKDGRHVTCTLNPAAGFHQSSRPALTNAG